MHEHEKTKPIMYMCQNILNSIFARIVVIKTFSSNFEILNCSFYDTFLER